MLICIKISCLLKYIENVYREVLPYDVFSIPYNIEVSTCFQILISLHAYFYSLQSLNIRQLIELSLLQILTVLLISSLTLVNHKILLYVWYIRKLRLTPDCIRGVKAQKGPINYLHFFFFSIL